MRVLPKLLALAVLAPASALAQTPEKPETAPTSAGGARVTAEERPFLYLLDPTTPSAGTATVSYGLGLGSGVPADRPLPANVAAANGSHQLSIGYGVTDRIAPFVTAAADVNAGASVLAGARLQLTDPSAPFRMTLALAGLREGKSGAGGAWVRAAASYDLGALRVAGNLHAERIFASARDRVDLLAFGGLSYRVLSSLRLGAEYVGQDLEDAIEAEEAEGGARHFVGPNAAIDLARGRLQITFGPAFGLNERSPRFLGRLGVLASF